MNYTIINTKANGQNLSIDKNGNKYTVCLADVVDELYNNKTYDTMAEAYNVYDIGVKMMVFGNFSYKQRCEILFGKSSSEN